MRAIILVTGILTTLHTGLTYTSDTDISPGTQEQNPLIYNNQDDAQLEKDCKEFAQVGAGSGAFISMLVVGPVCLFNGVSVGPAVAIGAGLMVLCCGTGAGIAALKARYCNDMYSEGNIDV